MANDIMSMIAAKRGVISETTLGKPVMKSAVRKKDENFDYYKLCHDTDPSYGPGTAVREWYSEHPEEAYEILDELGFISELYSSDIDEVLSAGCEDLADAFQAGRQSGDDFSWNDPWFKLDDIGHIHSLTQEQYEEEIQDIIEDNAEEIAGHYKDLPDELQEIIDLWDDE